MKKAIRLAATGRALPQEKITNEQLEKLVETSDTWIRTRTGIRERFVCKEEDVVSLAVQAAKQAIERAFLTESDFSKEKIRGILVATSTGTYHFPSTAALLQKELDLSTEVLCFDLGAACTGFVCGVVTAWGLLNGWEEGYLLLVGSEQLTKHVDYTDRGTCILFGDGAGAALLTLEQKQEGGAGKVWSDGNREILYCREKGAIQMQGQEVFRFALSAMTQTMEEVVGKAGISMEEVDHIVCHQANARMIAHMRKKYPALKERFYQNIETYGNTSAASIPIALDEMWEKGMLHRGQRILLVGFGAGLTWGGTLIYC